MPNLVLGPLLRYVGETEATVWVETNAACEVEVLGHSSRTFHVEGHHYALVRVGGLRSSQVYPYEVTLDGEAVWPEQGSPFPPSVIRTIAPGAALKLMFGSCHVALPHEPPYTLSKDEDPRGHEPDALQALAMRMRSQSHKEWPQVLLLLGDQVYADEVSPHIEQYLRSRRGPHALPHHQIAGFEEYTRLYLDAWCDPALRWLLSTVSTAMVFDDHDVKDDWNISEEWRRQMRAKSWWRERIIGAFMSYWLYQHLGNLQPRDLERDELYQRVREAEDAGPMLREFAYRADRENEGTRWSYHRDLGNARLVMTDTRAGRVLGKGNRSMVDRHEWAWIERQVRGDLDHLLLAGSLPVLLGPGMHYLEAWNEALCDGRWGRGVAKLSEKLRQGLDLEHWAAFQRSFHGLIELVSSVGAGERGKAPASIVMLAGDVHHAYLAQVSFSEQAGVQSTVYQAVCSPFRNPLDAHERRIIRAGWSRSAEHLARVLARAAGVKDPECSWRLVHPEPWFDNQVATLDLNGRAARLRIEKTAPSGSEWPCLETVYERRLA